MSVKEFATRMKTTIEQTKAKGTAAIYCDHLIEYLDQVSKSHEASPPSHEIEDYDEKFLFGIESYRQQHQMDRDMFRSVVDAGREAIKSSLLLNGGAAVALLAFIANQKSKQESVAEYADCLLYFTSGALTIVVVSGLTYLSQWWYAKPKKWTQNAGFSLNIVCIVLGFLSYVLFAKGIYFSYSAFSQ